MNISRPTNLNKQFAVYWNVCLRSDTENDPQYRGDWKLVGVEANNGEAADLTAELSELPEHLEQLRSEGFSHDGIVVHLQRDHG